MRRLNRNAAPLAAGILGTGLLLSACGAGGALVGISDPPAAVTTTAPVSAESATAIATRVLDAAQSAHSAKGAEAKRLQQSALTGAALTVTSADRRLESDAMSPTDSVTRREPPRVLAISRGSAWPRVILAQSMDEKTPVLHLLVSPKPSEPFKLSASARMEPGAEVAALNTLESGSPVVSDGAGLPVKPTTLMSEYAASLAYPKPETPAAVQADDRFGRAVRAEAGEQAKALGKLATLTQKHQVDAGQTMAVFLRDGGAVVFGLLKRQDTITLKPGGKSLTPSKDFQKLVGKKTLTEKAELTTYETVVFTVPAQGKASLVAVDEQLVSAKGQ